MILKPTISISCLSQTMKTISSVLAILLSSSLLTGAQGVIPLGQGDGYLFVQPTFVRGQINEAGVTFITISIGFSGDLFTPGDSLQIDVFTSPISVTPLATSTVSNPPWTRGDLTGASWTGQIWNAPGGAVRLTMLSGSVDISSVMAITAAYNSGEVFYSYTIPEPDSSLLLLFSGALFGGVRWIKRRKKRTG